MSAAITAATITLPNGTTTPSYPFFTANANDNTITANRPIASVYDTWSTHYERDGVANNLDPRFSRFYNLPTSVAPFTIDPLTNGIDDDGINGIDDPGEAEAPPPYPHALRGVQIKIRTVEPDTKQIREATLTHNFTIE
jgi:hypothetical protein